MKFITNGLIIKEQNIREKDKLVTVLTDSHGVIKAFVHGAKDIKSPKSAATTLLTYSRFTFHKRKENYLIGDARAEKIFSGLRNSIENMYLAQYFCELAGALCPVEQESKGQLRLILNALYLLSENKRDFTLVKPCVELRLMCFSGYMPDIMMCCECGEYEKDVMCFLPKTGRLICKDCCEKTENTEYKINLDRSSLTAMRHCCYCEDEKLFSFSLPQDNLKNLSFCSEEYIKLMLERDFKTLRFLKGLL